MPGLPGNLVATFANLEPGADTHTATMLLDHLFNGLVWAALCGLIGTISIGVGTGGLRPRHDQPPGHPA